MRALRLLAIVLLATSCRAGAPGGAGTAAGPAPAAGYDPSRALGPLFKAVQLAQIYPDSKTFVDARALRAPDAIVAAYLAGSTRRGFDLRRFVDFNFEPPRSAGGEYHTQSGQSMEDHIRALWPVLTRSADRPDVRSSLIPLPAPYVVPGGRFREVYYWDSYFTMLGLVRSGRTGLVRDMLDNFAALVRGIGHIPNGNRTYYLSRSQPPFFAAMVALFAAATDTTQALRYLDALEAEHAFWMDGAEEVAPGSAHRRVVRFADGTVLNRYWDDRDDPRPEAFREDYLLADTLPDDPRKEALWRNLRAAAESGWDFSSRWLRNPQSLASIETTRLVPVDLNSLLHESERVIAALRRFRRQPGDAAVADRFAALADARRRALLALAYDPATGFFYDLRFPSGERVADRPTLAGVVPLYFGLASPDQARAVADRLRRDFLKPGGFVTTLLASGQQWDAPNGWPPLEWMTIEGLRRYGLTELADTARDRWLALNRRTYQATGRMTEKYDVVDPNRSAGGGEYPNQDGFGWTNGVALALSAEEAAERGAGTGMRQEGGAVPAPTPSATAGRRAAPALAGRPVRR